MKEEEEAVISNGMNDEDTNNNINSCSEFENNRIGEGDGNGDDNCNLNRISQVWGTWEELVLTCAVQRHAFNDWDSVAKEVQLRKRTSFIASAVNCRLKYQDLKRRFEDSADGGGENSEAAEETVVDDEVGGIPWLEELRSLHVAELRRELQRCEDSIQSLQLKVTKLEEEKDGNDGDKKPDLGNDEIKPAKLNRETTESDRDNRSMNESNSTASVDKITDHERLNGEKLAHVNANSRNLDPDPVCKVAAPEEEEGTVSQRLEMSHSGGLDESGTSTCPGRKKGQKFRSGGDDDIKSAGDKSQPLIDIIKLIRSHPRGSVFESRLRSQGTKDYKSLIRQHLDIKTIEKKNNKGSYVSSSLSFYRDLKLLFTNAIVFFPSSSLESMAAHELRTLVSNEMKKRTGKLGYSDIKTEAQSAISRQKSSVLPLVVCKKKSSASKKTSPSSSFKHKDEKKSQEVSEEKTVTTTTTTSGRNSRRTSKEIAVVDKDTKTGRARNNNKKQTDTNTDSSNDDEKEETIKKEKKTVVAVASNKKKSVADFLKRIKKNSPEKGKETTTSKTQKKCDGNVKKENDQPKKSNGNVKKENSKAKPRELRSNTSVKRKAEVDTNNNNNKPSLKRKQPKETEEATGKRSRESVKNNKQTKKRSRR